jgi:membrane-associated phospholipid phosphatase
MFYFFTFISLIILMSTVKNLSGVHRPFFFDICKPNLGLNCTQGSYVSSEFECTNTEANAYVVSESTRSFPSGHVVSVVYSCAVLMWYLQAKISKFPLVVTFLHLICILWMTVCSVSRITDNWHHVSDVLGGLILTLPFVVYNVSFSVLNKLS